MVRFQQLNIISTDQATSLYKQISKRGWNKAEPVTTTNEEPIWLSRAIAQRTGSAIELSGVRQAAETIGLSETYMLPWLDWSPVQDHASLIEFRPRDRPARSIAADGHIIEFPSHVGVGRRPMPAGRSRQRNPDI